MSNVLIRRIGMVLMLAAAVLAGGRLDWFSLAVFAFGVVNALVAVPGTTYVRAIAVGAATLALLPIGSVDPSIGYSRWQATIPVLAYLAWPPAMIVAWALARDSRSPEPPPGVIWPGGERHDASNHSGHARTVLAGIIVAVAVGALAYRLIVGQGLQQTAALFVGIPALLAIVVIYAVSPRSAIGVAIKAVTIGLLVSLLFLGEGVLCIVMSAPLFYAVAIGVGLAVDTARRRRRSQTALSCAFLLTLVPMSLEGVTTATSLNREESLSVTRTVAAPADAVERALFEEPRFERVLPPYLRAGFPRPMAVRVDGTGVAARWVVRMRGGEMRIDGIEPRAGDLVLRLEEARDGRVRWRAESDDSHMTHFLDWREAIVEWRPIDEHTTTVTWTLRYRRGLDPAWYFGPWERYAVRLAAGYLIEAVATP